MRSLYSAVTSCRKSETNRFVICHETYNTRFGPLFVQNPSQRFLPKNQKSVLSLYAAVILCKKSEKLNTYFIKHEKLKNKYFSKNVI